jgi:hypothetical protein
MESNRKRDKGSSRTVRPAAAAEEEGKDNEKQEKILFHVTNSMEHISSREYHIRPTSQEISYICGTRYFLPMFTRAHN